MTYLEKFNGINIEKIPTKLASVFTELSDTAGGFNNLIESEKEDFDMIYDIVKTKYPEAIKVENKPKAEQKPVAKPATNKAKLKAELVDLSVNLSVQSDPYKTNALLGKIINTNKRKYKLTEAQYKEYYKNEAQNYHLENLLFLSEVSNSKLLIDASKMLILRKNKGMTDSPKYYDTVEKAIWQKLSNSFYEHKPETQSQPVAKAVQKVTAQAVKTEKDVQKAIDKVISQEVENDKAKELKAKRAADKVIAQKIEDDNAKTLATQKKKDKDRHNKKADNEQAQIVGLTKAIKNTKAKLKEDDKIKEKIRKELKDYMNEDLRRFGYGLGDLPNTNQAAINRLKSSLKFYEGMVNQNTDDFKTIAKRIGILNRAKAVSKDTPKPPRSFSVERTDKDIALIAKYAGVKKQKDGRYKVKMGTQTKFLTGSGLDVFRDFEYLHILEFVKNKYKQAA